MCCLPPACPCTLLHRLVWWHCRRGTSLVPCPVTLAAAALPIPVVSGRPAWGAAMQSTRQLPLSLALQEGSEARAGVCCPLSGPRWPLRQDPSPRRCAWHHPLLPVPIPHLPPPPAQLASPTDSVKEPEMARRGEMLSHPAVFSAPPGDRGNFFWGTSKPPLTHPPAPNCHGWASTVILPRLHSISPPFPSQIFLTSLEYFRFLPKYTIVSDERPGQCREEAWGSRLWQGAAWLWGYW